MQMHLRMFPS
uniref:Uncharacterized protein n=1 Tax=Anguilla anguilla TaxID=7936 RepID=A0A0E9T6I6_ANGAN